MNCVHTEVFTSMEQRSQHAEKLSHVRTLQFCEHWDMAFCQSTLSPAVLMTSIKDTA